MMFGFGVKKEGAFEGRLNCMIGEESRFRGDISVNGSARIDGDFEGSIVATESVIVGKCGVVRADVQARDMVVAGAVAGNLRAHDRVELHAGARVDGDIETRTLVVDEGVTFNGKCAMPEPVAAEGAAVGKTGSVGRGENGHAPGTEAETAREESFRR
ncbi:MAG: polymer-forming cytoskeletal protein [Candidatus Eisenbacteria bacterium]|nr:polymer-forming cytoskeletal protein [Candidatus Eisenbacteria bacterium]